MCCLSFVKPRVAWRFDGTRDMPVEALFPEGRERFELGPPPVGRGSWGLMPLAARHTAISPMRAVLGWLPGGAQIGSASPWQA